MSTKVDVLDTTVQKTINLLEDVCAEFSWPDEERRFQAYKALRSVLHAVRDRLPVTESANFAAQLPMLVRGFYYEGWKPERVPLKFHREEFLDEVQKSFQLSVVGGAPALVEGTLRALSRHIEPAVVEKLKRDFPADLRPLFEFERAA